MNNTLRIITWKWNDQQSNLSPLCLKWNVLSITTSRHTLKVAIEASLVMWHVPCSCKRRARRPHTMEQASMPMYECTSQTRPPVNFTHKPAIHSWLLTKVFNRHSTFLKAAYYWLYFSTRSPCNRRPTTDVGIWSWQYIPFLLRDLDLAHDLDKQIWPWHTDSVPASGLLNWVSKT